MCNVKENKSGLKDKQKKLHNHYMLTTITKFKHGVTNYWRGQTSVINILLLMNIKDVFNNMAFIFTHTFVSFQNFFYCKFRIYMYCLSIWYEIKGHTKFRCHINPTCTLYLIFEHLQLIHHQYYFSYLFCVQGLQYFFNCTSTSLFTGSTFYKNLENFHEYLIQHSLKSRGTKDHLRWVKVPGTAPYRKACVSYNFVY